MPKITTFNVPRIDSTSIVSRLIADNDIRSVDTELSDKETIVAHNFTRDVFQSTFSSASRWTPLTTSARGLFTSGEKIVGRGFPKFFALGETQSEEQDMQSFTYPIQVHSKLNGFLAIAFYTEASGLIITNKSGMNNTFDTLNIANNVVKAQTELYDLLESFLSTHQDVSITLEIIAPSHGDAHIVKYTKDRAIPLAVIDNITGNVCPEYEQTFGIHPIKTLHNQEELKAFIEKTRHDEHDLTEGYVLRGANNFQLKLKTPFYLRAKSVRGRLAKRLPLSKAQKMSWPYGGETWFNIAATNHLTFSPEWAEKMQLMALDATEDNA